MEFKPGDLIKHKIGREKMIVLGNVSEGHQKGKIQVRRQTRETVNNLEIWYREDFFYPFELEKLDAPD